MDFYVQRDGQKLGPFLETRIRQGIDAGEFVPNDLAWTVGKASWQPISALINLDVNQPPPHQSTAASENHGKPLSSPQPPPLEQGAGIKAQNSKSIWQMDLARSRPGAKMYLASKAILVVFWTVALGGFAYLWISPRFWPNHRAELNSWRLSNPKPAYDQVPVQEKVESSFAGIGAKASDFYTAYGQPNETTVIKDWLPASHAAVFRDGDLSYMLAFWYDRGHYAMIFRRDRGKLTQQNIERALGRFTDGSEWIRQSDTYGTGREVWKSEKAVAFVQPVRSDSSGDNDVPVNHLIIQTYEFLIAAENRKSADK